MDTKMLPTLSCTFKYGGHSRTVENVTVEEDTQTIIGMETRKNGKFSNKIKRYALEKMEEVRFG